MARELILLVEDEPAVSASIRRRLTFEGFTVEVATTGNDGLEQVRTLQPQLVILDVMLPGLNGFEVAERLRHESDVPILMLTARDSVQDRVTGLERGADDYLTKPFAIEELLARVRALLRRTMPREDNSCMVVGHLSLDPLSREVTSGGQVVSLTPREFALLEHLMRHTRQVLRRDQIFEAVWGHDHLGESNVIDVYVRQLREKLESSGQARLIHTVRGVGYVLREE